MNELYEKQESLNLWIPKKIAVIGIGGVGSWVALFTAMIGCKEILIIDDDILEIHNLNRTPYCEFQVGMKKVDAMEMLINERRPDCKVTVIPKKAMDEDFEKLHNEGYVIIDCRDTADMNTDYSPAVGGYDGESITIEINPRNNKHWSTGLPIRYTVPSYILPPVFIATVIIYVITHPQFYKDKYMCKTFKLNDVIKALEVL